MNNEQQEAFLAEKLKEFTDKLADVAKEVITDVYCDYLPHVMTDTESNVCFKTSSALEDILSGKFTVDGDYLVVSQGTVRVYLGNNYSNLATNIYKNAKDKIENQTIKELETKIQSLNMQLLDAYRCY